MSSLSPSRAGLESVLAKIGRASTPTVAENNIGLTLSRLLNQKPHLSPNCVKLYGVVGAAVRDELIRQNISFKAAIPGDSFQTLPSDFRGVVIVDRSGFTAGPWLGIETESGIRLREEVYEMCRYSRNNGIPVWFLDSPQIDTFSVTRIKSACDVTFPYLTLDDFEEGAPMNIEFKVIEAAISRRFDFEGMA